MIKRFAAIGFLGLGCILSTAANVEFARSQQNSSAVKKSEPKPNYSTIIKQAVALIQGQGVPQNKAAGLEQLEAAAKSDVWAKVTLAGLLMAGVDVPQDQPRAVELYKQASASGNVAATSALASAYLLGTGVAADPQQARQLLDKAIIAGDVGAKRKLGEALIRGQGLTLNADAGLTVLTAAAGQDVWAKVSLAGFLMAGKDVPKDQSRALDLYRQAADAGNSTALTALATAYQMGNGVAADPTQARAYFLKAIELGSVGARMKLGEALIKGQGLAKDPVAGLMILKAAAEKDVWAKVALAGLLLAGEHLPKDRDRAIQLFQQAANSGNSFAMSALASLYLTGTGVAADPARARQLLLRAIELGDNGARKKLGEALIKGQGLPRDATAGLMILSGAAKNDVWAKVSLAGFVLAGTDVPKNAPLALDLYQQAAAAGNASANSILGSLYLNGNGVAADPTQARAFLLRAIELGDVGAKRKLGEALVKGEGLRQDVAAGMMILRASSDKDPFSKLSLSSLYMNGRYVKQDLAQARGLAFEAAHDKQPSGLLALGNYYLAKPASPFHSQLAQYYLVNAAQFGAGNAWVAYARGLNAKKIINSKISFETCVKHALAAHANDIVVVDAQRYLYGIGVPKSISRYFSILQGAARAGNVEATKALLRTYRNGVRPIIAKDSARATAEIRNFAPQLGEDRVKAEIALVRLSNLSTPKQFQTALKDSRFSEIIERIDLAYEVSTTNPTFQVFRLQEKLARAGLYAGKPSGNLNRRLILAIRNICASENQGQPCAEPVATPLYIQTLLTSWNGVR